MQEASLNQKCKTPNCEEEVFIACHKCQEYLCYDHKETNCDVHGDKSSVNTVNSMLSYLSKSPLSSQAAILTTTSNVPNLSTEHPWPYLSGIFELTKCEGKTYRFKCLKCCTSISSFCNSPSNLKKHLERMHSSSVAEYTKLTTANKKRRAVSVSTSERATGNSGKQQKLDNFNLNFNNPNLVSQKAIDNAVMDLIVSGVLPLQIVELPEFKNLIGTLQPNREVISRATLRSSIVAANKKLKDKLVSELKQQTYIATTADCWSSFGKSYLGATVHWIDRETLSRKSACMALRRMKGPHTFDAIAKMLEDIHIDFCIHRKVVRTTTDNGSNFIKAFSVFGASDEHSTSTQYSDEDSSDNEIDEAHELVDIDALLENRELEHELPRHYRCACHSINLIATKDQDKAESDASYKRLSRSAFAKCQGLWNMYGRSTAAVEAVSEFSNLSLKRPNATRWNSVFLAVERLVRLMKDKGEEDFNAMCFNINRTRFNSNEIQFLQDYVSVMKYVAQALNIMQSENRMYMGYLLPTICMLKDKLTFKLTTSVCCKPLVQALLTGIDTRFKNFFKDDEAVAAAVLIPKFKTCWTEDQTLIERGIRYIRYKLENSRSKDISPPHSIPGTDSDEDEENFLLLAQRKDLQTILTL